MKKRTFFYLLSSLLTLPGFTNTHQLNSHECSIPLFYWDARPKMGFSNFGDALSESIVERMLNQVIETQTDPILKNKKFLAVGSILNYAQDGDVIWGTGKNGKCDKASDYQFTNLDVRAVRGPLTRKFLISMGIDCPEVYGDPTLLLPRLFPEFKKSENPKYEYIFIPHYSDEAFFCNCSNMVSVKEQWKDVVEKILDSKFVISSALSGVIVAEAFGIPARLLVSDNENNTETLFKYTDYYSGTNRESFQFATTIEQALDMGGEPLPNCDLDKLYNAFPFDLF
ncbi:MAG: polysaccharide pyruvyl transferase family protein [Parachlamydiales bacterium]|nr:polysaccharide pyruvyl transferase family protein [Parachlamydiales bacterium]